MPQRNKLKVVIMVLLGVPLTATFITTQTKTFLLHDYDRNKSKDASRKIHKRKNMNKEEKIKNIEEIASSLTSIQKKMSKPAPGDWLSVHYEPGQSFSQYRASHPPIPNQDRRIIFILPIGEFTPRKQKLVELTAQFMNHWFGLEVKIKHPVALAQIPADATRTHPQWGDFQVLTGYILNNILKPMVTDETVGVLALTTFDLWPGKGWNFVFGEASLRDRVGLWSIYRKGNPDGGEEEFKTTMRRTLQTAVHEMGHMLGMLHCKKFQCAMNGSNSLSESDRRPLHLCPECLKKLLWATDWSAEKRFEALARFCTEHGLRKDGHYFKEALRIIKNL